MATLDEIGEALRNADAAGDSQAATVLAEEYARLKSAASQSSEPIRSVKPLSRWEAWRQVPGEAISNLGPSAGRFVEGVTETVAHPEVALSNLRDVAVGGAANLLPEVIAPDATDEQKQKASNVGEYYKHRYGTEEGFRDAVSKDPVGVMADVSTVMGGVGGVASKVPQLAKAGEAISTASRYADPLSLVSRAGGAIAPRLGNGVAHVIGLTTGAGSTAIKKAFEAGRSGGDRSEAFVRHLRGDADIGEIVDDAKGALQNMRRARGEAYRQGMAGISQDKTVLDFDPIDQALADVASSGKYKGQVIQPSTDAVIAELRKTVDAWGELPAAEYHTPEGLDALKQLVGDIREGTQPHTNARRVSDRVYNAVKSEIINQAPDYANVMKGYEDASNTTREIERALSLGDKAATDTSVRKLQSLTRNNVNTNYGNRMKLADELEQSGAPDLMTKLSGQALNDWTPRGINRAAILPEAGIAYEIGGVPLALGAAAVASPRLMGEASHLVGKGAGGYDAIRPRLDKIPSRRLANILYQMDRVQEGAR